MAPPVIGSLKIRPVDITQYDLLRDIKGQIYFVHNKKKYIVNLPQRYKNDTNISITLLNSYNFSDMLGEINTRENELSLIVPKIGELWIELGYKN